MIKGLNMVVVPVADWAKAREWYVNKLGVELVEEYPEDGYGEYSLSEGGARIGLWGLPKGYSVLHGDGAKLVAPMPYIEVDDLEKAVAGLKAKGVEFDQVLDDGEFKTARFRDPDGHILFLYELVRD
jgi:catechol 2,3-dioxygenase-like lactoylglutathione lyase family enzyme